MSIQGMGYGIGYILGTLYPSLTPDYEDKYLKLQRKLKKKDAIFDKRMETLYGDAWEKIKAKRHEASMREMFSIK